MSAAEIDAFWELARHHLRTSAVPGYFPENALGSLRPPAWSFGVSPEQADRLGDAVLAGAKTATAAALWDHEAAGEPLPTPGTLGIVCDSRDRPLALIATTTVEVVPFDEVPLEHALAEGLADVAEWRDAHRRFFTEHAEHGRGFADDMPVVLERFRVIYPPPGRT